MDIGFENGEPVQVIAADRGERAEVDMILTEAGYAGYIDEQIESGIRDKALQFTRAALLSIINPPAKTSRAMQAVIVGYALGVPGLPSMGKCAIEFGLGKAGKAAISKRVKKYCAEYDLPPSSYMKSAAACEVYQTTNRRKQK